MDSTKIRANDVAIILRPDFEEGQEWKGNFQIIIGGYGPVTLSEDSMRELVSMAMLMATSIPMMEQDVNFTERLMELCMKVYGDADDVMMSDVDGDFNIETKCVGSMQ